MPISHRKNGWYWGSRGPFTSRDKAVEVAQAAYSSGYEKGSDITKDIGYHVNGPTGTDSDNDHSKRPGYYREESDIYHVVKKPSQEDGMITKAEKPKPVYDAYTHVALDPTLEESRKTYGQSLGPTYESEISKYLAKRNKYMGDIRENLNNAIAKMEKQDINDGDTMVDDNHTMRAPDEDMEKCDDGGGGTDIFGHLTKMIEKAEAEVAAIPHIRMLLVDAAIRKAEGDFSTIDDYDLVRAGVGRPVLALLQKSGRPSKDWWGNCVAKATAFSENPADVCGEMWLGKSDAEAVLDIVTHVIDTLRPQEEGETIAEAVGVTDETAAPPAEEAPALPPTGEHEKDMFEGRTDLEANDKKE